MKLLVHEGIKGNIWPSVTLVQLLSLTVGLFSEDKNDDGSKYYPKGYSTVSAKSKVVKGNMWFLLFNM